MSDKNLASKMTVPGFYGKLPVLGDFVSRRLTREFINDWDEWLQMAIACSKEQLGKLWLDYYLSSPVWRFVISPGVCGTQACVGVVMASVDRVGRYFPFTIALAIGDIQEVSLTSNSVIHWFDEIEALALTALEKDLSIHEIDGLLNHISSECWFNKTVVSVDDNDESASHSAKKAFYLQSQNGNAALQGHFQGLNNCLINNCFAGYSLWQTRGSETVNPALLMSEGLPPVSAFSGLLGGPMSTRGWDLQKKRFNFSDDSKTEGLNTEETMTESLLKVNSSLHQQSRTLIWQSQSAIDCGKRRQHNEDALLDRSEKGLWVVADGMGGHQAGDVASTMIVEALDHLDFHWNKNLQQRIDAVSTCLYQVNEQLQQLAANHYHNQIVGSTVVTLIAGDGQFACIWAGDSRLYRFRDKILQQITVDHCEQMESMDGLFAIGRQALKVNNVITRAVGAFDELELDCKYIDCQAGDKLLLCSDGVDKELSCYEIEKILNKNNGNDANVLMQAVLEKQARDNISIIVIKINQRE